MQSRCRAARSSTCRRVCRPGCSGGECSRSGGSRSPRPTANRGARGAGPLGSRAASGRSCGDHRCRSSSARAGGDWSPCRRRGPRRGVRRTGTRPGYAAGSRSSSTWPTAGVPPAWRAPRDRRARARRGRRRARAAGGGGRSWRARRRAPDGSGGGRDGAGWRAFRDGSRGPRRAPAGGRVPRCRPRSGRSSVRPSRSSAARRNARSKPTLWPTNTASPDEVDERAEHGADARSRADERRR